MTQPPPVTSSWLTSFKTWLLQGQREEHEGFYEEEPQAHHHTQPWWKAMCLTGVDYFSTLGYQPGIAALAAISAGSLALSPVATLVLVLVTLFGALPMYRRVAQESPHGDGSISMLERLLTRWQSKSLVLVLLGFVATGFFITITLSAADAAAHIVENPFLTHYAEGWNVPITLLLIFLLGAVFLKGFGEAIGIAVALVVLYLGLNAVVIADAFRQVLATPSLLANWTQSLSGSYSNPLALIGAALLVFPRLALGLSGFETGVVVMPLVKGDASDTEENPAGRIRNTRTLLTAAALIMSVMLIGSSFATTLLISPEAFKPGGEASGRALAYLAHERLGEVFGTVYDLSTILILWFAGSSAMAGLLNIVPRYLPRYGMAPAWARMNRPLVLIFTAVSVLLTVIFRADVNAQAAAYATGVLVLIGSASVAVTLSAVRRKARGQVIGFGLVSLIFAYTLLVTFLDDLSGLRLGLLFILAIVVVSILSRIGRATELRAERIELDPAARAILDEASRSGDLRFIANQLDAGDAAEYTDKEQTVRAETHLPSGEPCLFLEVTVADPSEFSDVLDVRGFEIHGYRVLRIESSAVPNAIAAFLLYLRDTYGQRPHVYFEWIEGSPVAAAGRFLLLGEGDVPPLTREILRRAEPIRERRPVVHVGG
ncbi:amino acid transporter (plasmid) [Deinococcus taeanensis]|uniref:amino acid transporter n=1 Tax=Deinococcus taeanensis TaxID=2737050 RepID=UPI001CDD8C34|nr:amino acid transporter [Deinococcus taeanensis]UBV45091.1 amino acid transporter [Deinococcus taeanensis]